MTIETGALEQAYAKVETTYAIDPADTLAGSDAVSHLDLSLGSQLNRPPSPEKRGTPDEAQSLPARATHQFDLSSVMWMPSGTLGTGSSTAKFLKAGMGTQTTNALATTVSASPAPTATGCSLASAVGIAVNDLIVLDIASNTRREITRVKSVSTWTVTPPIAIVGALAGAGAGNVDNGTHSYKVTFVGASGETQGGAVSNTVTVIDKTMDGKIALTGIPLGPTGTTSRKVYRSAAGNAVTGPWLLQSSIANNTATTLTDNTADSGLTTTLADPAITYDALSAAPDSGGDAVVGLTFKLSNNLTETFAVYKFYNSGGFKQAVYGAVINRIQASFDGTQPVRLAIQGPAGRYGDNALIPDAPTATLAGAGAGLVTSGTHSYLVVFGRNQAPAKGQMGTASGSVTTATGSDGKVNLTAIPLGPTGTVRRYIYRTAAGNALVGPWLLLTTIEDNTTTTYLDNIADGSLGATAADLEVQAKPATYSITGTPASGLVGNVYIDGHEFPVISATVTVENNEELRNKELGYVNARGIAGRSAMRKVSVSFTIYLEDLRLLKYAKSVQQSVLRLVVGDTNGGMVGCVCPKVEYEIPAVGNEVGPKNITVNGVAYATDGNDQVFFAEL
jgi:hypothetical protein